MNHECEVISNTWGTAVHLYKSETEENKTEINVHHAVLVTLTVASNSTVDI